MHDTLYNVRKFGARGDGQRMDVPSIQRAIDTCYREGGGTVYLPPGRYLAGTIELKDRVSLYLENGSILLGSTDIDDYEPCHLLYARGVENIALRGDGIIDGQGESFWETWRKEGKPRGRAWRPSPLLEFVECRNLSIEGITIINAPGWAVHPFFCDDVKISGITIENPVHTGPNTDGIDIDASRNVIVTGCNIITGDDAVVLKNTNRHGLRRPVRNVTVSNCLLTTRCNGFKIGTETQSDFENITFSNSSIYHYSRGRPAISGVAIESVDGGRVEGVLVSNIRMKNVRAPIFCRLGRRLRDGVNAEPGLLRDIRLEGIVARGAQVTSSITGLPEKMVGDLALRDIRISTRGEGAGEMTGIDVPEHPEAYPEATMFGELPAAGFFCRHMERLDMQAIHIESEQADQRPVLRAEDVGSFALDGLSVNTGLEDRPVLELVDVGESFIRGCRAPEKRGPFLRASGRGTRKVMVSGNDLSGVETAVEAGEGLDEGAVFCSGNRGPSG